MPVAVSARAPKPVFARKGANPTLETIEYIRALLEQAGQPVSRNRILDQLAAWGHSSSRPSLNAALSFLSRDGSLIEGSKGLQWVPQAEGRVLDAIRRSHA